MVLTPATITEWAKGKTLPPEAVLRRRLSLSGPRHLHPLALQSSKNTALTSPLLLLGRHLRPHLPMLHSIPTHLSKRLLPSICLGVPHSVAFAHILLSTLTAPPHSRSQHFQSPLQPSLYKVLCEYNLFQLNMSYC